MCGISHTFWCCAQHQNLAKTCRPAAGAQLAVEESRVATFQVQVTTTRRRPADSHHVPNNKAELAQMETHMPMDEEVKAHLRQARQAPRALLAPLAQHIHTSNWQPFQEVDSLPLHATGMALDCRRAAAR